MSMLEVHINTGKETYKSGLQYFRSEHIEKKDLYDHLHLHNCHTFLEDEGTQYQN